MGVARHRRAVGGPACVRDPGKAREMIAGDAFGEFGHALGAARAPQLAIAVHGHAAGIVAPVFKATKAFDEDGGDVARCDGSDDATHVFSPSSSIVPLSSGNFLSEF